ncbi:MAG TPA: kelch repeat-containing protein, partial [Thermoplasmata archaeon]|nr:kelch repeat-containing protein [Thermoplasmata archaeon]
NNETWAYGLESNTWTNMTAPGSPSRRFETHMVYDAESDRIILFGGLGPGFALLRETWTYDLNTNTWTNENPTPMPSAAANDYMAYDVRSDRMIHFGGVIEPLPLESGETWAYDLNANRWTNLDPTPSPSPRSVSAMAYDAESDRIVMVLRSVANMETWVFHFTANSWVDATGGGAPTRRDRGYRMAYDAGSDRMIFFGGQFGGDEGVGTPPPYFDDTWAFDLNAVAPPGSTDLLFPLLAGVVAAGAAVGVVTIVLLRRRRRKNEKSRER